MNQIGKRKIDPSVIKKILLIRLRRIGDIVMTTPALTALRECLPQAFISYVVEEPYRELIEGNPSLDETLILPPNQRIGEFLRFIHHLRKRDFDAVLDFHSGPRASWITLFSKAKLKIGYDIKYRKYIYDIMIPRSRKNGHYHSVQNHINLVKTLGVPVDSIPSLYLPSGTKEESERVKKLIEEAGLRDFKIVAFHIGAGNEFRDWGPDNIVELSSLLLKLPKVRVALVGSSEDQRAEETIMKKSALPLSSLVGRLNLRELREFIQASKLFVGPNSGPMHIAASTSTPIVAYFGPSLPANFAPWTDKASIIEKDLDCRPCKQRQCLYKDFRCIRTIKPEEIFKACLLFLQERENSGGSD